MTKKAHASLKPGLSMRHVLCLGWKLVILVSVVLCLLAFLRIQQYSRSTDSSFSAALPRKSLVLGYQFRGTPKIAFLFLLRRNLPLDFLWENFFENVDKRNFSIYIHSEPGFVFDESTTRSTVFFDRQLKNSIKRRPPIDASRGKMNLKLQKQHNCIPDEHYVQTLLAMNDLETELERRTVTYTLWNQSMANTENEAWHPYTFGYADAGPQQIKRINMLTAQS
ncbi:Glycosyltransferase BC10 [Sesamum angolense]|uniref:Glycosyltransferase BC10 n=1 Tax=Sesamum angolense TaxID=2727404 RepID=A0AAE2BV23_9LAMI|nr:Glycosyltransferase BC10 [Sesamum angolense]